MKGIIEIQKADTRASGAQPRKMLDDVLATTDTVLCLVFGEGKDPDEVSTVAEKLARTSSGCEAVQVVRILDPQVLTAAETAAWKPAAPNVATLLTSDRKVSKRLSASHALAVGDFLIALVQATAGVTE